MQHEMYQVKFRVLRLWSVDDKEKYMTLIAEPKGKGRD